MNIYAIKDEALNRFMQPFFTHTNAAAIRAFGDHVNENGSPSNQHPGDYTLFYLGHFDEETGTITGDTERLVSGADVLDAGKVVNMRKQEAAK